MLTDKQKQFCKEYLVDLNATQAAIRAGYSKETANRIASQNLSKPHVMAEIQRLMDKRSEKVEITAEDVLKDILDTRDTLAQNMLKNDSGEVDSSVANARLKANELLGKHLKLFTDKVEHSGKVDSTIVIEIEEDD